MTHLGFDGPRRSFLFSFTRCPPSTPFASPLVQLTLGCFFFSSFFFFNFYQVAVWRTARCDYYDWCRWRSDWNR